MSVGRAPWRVEKVRRGKKERYLKDEHALDDFLVAQGVRSLVIETGSGEAIDGD